MRRTTLGVLLLAAGCGGGGGNGDGPPPGDDAPHIDSRTDLPDAPMATCTPVAGTNVDFEELPGLNDALDNTPVLVTSPPGDRRLFIVERNGVIQIYVDGAMLPTPFLDIDSDTNGGGEAGLLGLAFHPDFGSNGKFYLYNTTGNDPGMGACSQTVATGTQEIAEYNVSSGDANVADPTSKRTLLSVPDQAGNHNGGMLEFGADGYLYISVGDGGPQNDPGNDAQNLDCLLGKILRIDVDHPGGGREYGIPSDNPFADGSGGAPEVFVYGMRNPWRWSFDRATGDMYVGDVGQDTIEEVTVIPAGQQNNANLGWCGCEGTLDHATSPGGGLMPCSPTNCAAPTGNQKKPASEHTHSSGFNAVIGGQVYRGSCYPDIVGTYFYSDHGASELWSFVYSGGQATDDHFIRATPGGPASLHADALGELYLTTADGGPEGVWHLVVR